MSRKQVAVNRGGLPVGGFSGSFFHLHLNWRILVRREVPMLREDSAPEIAGVFASRWWVVLLRGIIAIAFGVLAFAWPGVTVATLVLLFGFYALVDGIFSLLTAIGGRRHREDRWLLALEGIVGIWIGVVTLRDPALTAVVLVFLISIWAMATGFLRIAAAIRLRQAISGEVWLALSGVLSVLFALMLILRPAVGALGLVWVIAGYALILGVFEIMLGVELRGVRTT
jgi:uncharacterized membrane protein HdeD (DUF308 family)